MANRRVLWERDNVKCIFLWKLYGARLAPAKSFTVQNAETARCSSCLCVLFQVGVPAAVDEPASSRDWIDIQPIRGVKRDVGSVTTGDWLGRLLVLQNHGREWLPHQTHLYEYVAG